MKGIQAIKLLKGHHADTGATGQGCFMDVVAYLNGEPVITDNSPCVCPILRSMLVQFNDTANNEQRQLLLPYLLRAMGSRASGFVETERRTALVVQYAEKQIARAKQYARFFEPTNLGTSEIERAQDSLRRAASFADTAAWERKQHCSLFAMYLHDVISDCAAYAHRVGMDAHYASARTKDFLNLLDNALLPLEGAPSLVVAARIGELVAAAT